VCRRRDVRKPQIVGVWSTMLMCHFCTNFEQGHARGFDEDEEIDVFARIYTSILNHTDTLIVNDFDLLLHHDSPLLTSRTNTLPSNKTTIVSSSNVKQQAPNDDLRQHESNIWYRTPRLKYQRQYTIVLPNLFTSPVPNNYAALPPQHEYYFYLP
jgi:hypothetical protein